MDVSIQLLRGDKDEVVAATLRVAVAPAQVNEAEAVWGPFRKLATDQLKQRGVPATEIPEHAHWDWSLKSPALELLAYRGFAIECDNETQGLMLLLLAGESCRLMPAKGKPLVYIDYIESAPWNIRKYVDPPRFREVGRVLVRTAVQTSIEEGFRGRIGLHSLPQSVGFYRDKIGMTMLGVDSAKKPLVYFEMTQEQAMRFTK